MSEILFRGKRLDNQVWVEGYYLCLHGEEDLHIIVDAEGQYHRVDPETVGQFTCLTDENGDNIFESDIVQAHFATNHSKQKFCVVFDDGMFLFDNNCVKVPKYNIYAMKIIGNIHDNPELLNGGNENG